jgi:hypothetical protein
MNFGSLSVGAFFYKLSPVLDRYLAVKLGEGVLTMLTLVQSVIGQISSWVEQSFVVPKINDVTKAVIDKQEIKVVSSIWLGMLKTSMIAYIFMVISGLFVYDFFSEASINWTGFTLELFQKLIVYFILYSIIIIFLSMGRIITSSYYAMGSYEVVVRVGLLNMLFVSIAKILLTFYVGVEGLIFSILLFPFLNCLWLTRYFPGRYYEHKVNS